MAETDESGVVPSLRFSEFRSAPAWRAFALAELADQSVPWSFTGGPFGSNLKASDYTPEGVRIIQLQNIGEGEFIDDYKIYTSQEKADELLSCNAFPNEIILSKMGDPVGRACVLPSTEQRYLMCSDGIRLVVNHSQFDSRFVFQSINSQVFRARVDSAASGSTRKRIGLESLRNIPIEIPSCAEQQKIAECLTQLDVAISSQARKVETLKAHKRGLMQQLFPREGETVPRLRFSEFRDAPEWVTRELGPLTSKVGSGVTPLGGEKAYKPTGRPFVRSQNVGWGELLLDDVAFIDENTHRSFDSTEIKVSDVLLNITGASIGRSAVADLRIAGGNVNQHVCIIRTKPSDLNPELLSQYLISEFGQKQIGSFQAGGNRQGLNFGQIRGFQIPLPQRYREQQRIADALSSLDEQITAESERLDALGSHKAGLMQQLFPSPDAG